MTSEQLTKAQCAVIRSQANAMASYHARLNDRMDYKGFPADDPIKRAVVDALSAAQKLYRETLSRSIGVTALPERKEPPLHPFFTRKSAPRKGERH